MAKFLDENGLLYLWSKIKGIIPTKVTQLTNDAGYITASEVPEGSAASKITPKMSGTAALGTDNGFARGDHVHPSDTSKADKATTLVGYGITDAYTKTEIDAKMTSAVHYKGTKTNYSQLPTSDNTVGDMWNITNADATHGINAGDNVVWNGSTWDVQAGTVDLSSYVKNTDLITNSDIDIIVAD